LNTRYPPFFASDYNIVEVYLKSELACGNFHMPRV